LTSGDDRQQDGGVLERGDTAPFCGYHEVVAGDGFDGSGCRIESDTTYSTNSVASPGLSPFSLVGQAIRGAPQHQANLARASARIQGDCRTTASTYRVGVEVDHLLDEALLNTADHLGRGHRDLCQGASAYLHRDLSERVQYRAHLKAELGQRRHHQIGDRRLVPSAGEPDAMGRSAPAPTARRSRSGAVPPRCAANKPYLDRCAQSAQTRPLCHNRDGDAVR
jgi:hypothetical protein